MNCTTTGGQSYPITVTQDLNEGNRRGAWEGCIRAHGYYTVGELPLEMESQFKNPVKIDAGSSPVKGNASAKITLIEFSDFQCPFCKRGMELMADVLKEYPNDVKLVFKNLPLRFHPQAKPAAIAALAAKQQGKFWEMHDALFANQNRLGEEFFTEVAGKIGLDIEKFKKDLADPKLASEVEQDVALATKLGVQGTPSFFLNGVHVKGTRPLLYFKLIIERWKKQLG